MGDQPAFFDLGQRPPTTKTLALRIKAEGPTSALDQAQLRADAARYQEVTCRSALNPVQGMPFNWTLNPYRGCTHGCHYCFARRYQTQFELGPGDHFSSVIFVKTNLAEVLKRELDKPSWTREQVAVGTATDPYQPIEGHYKLTRRALEALIAGPNAHRPRHKGADGRARCGSACRAWSEGRLQRVHERAYRRRGGLGRTRAGHRASAPAIARGPNAARGRRQRRRADGAGRPRFHDATGQARGDDQGCRRAWRRVHGRQPSLPEGGHQRSLHGFLNERAPGARRRVQAAVSRGLRAETIRSGRSSGGEGASGTSRRPSSRVVGAVGARGG